MTEQSKQPAWFFWFFAVFTVLTMIPFGYLVFDFITHPLAPDIAYGSVAFRLITALLIVPICLIGSVLVLRRAPRNVTGLFLLIWTVYIMVFTVRLDSPVSEETFNFMVVGVWFLPLFFPDGQPSPQRYGKWVRLLSVYYTIMAIGMATSNPTVNLTRLQQQMGQVANPIFVPVLLPFKELFGFAGFFGFVMLLIVIVPSIALRYRASDFAVRQQIKWLLWAYGLIIGGFVLIVIVLPLLNLPPDFTAAVNLVFGVFYQLAPLIVVGNAILRHRLYDIDIIIRRTLVYSILTAILAAIYFGGVVLAQQVFRFASGQSSDPAIVASTLLIAALFTPLRRRIQRTIDRRFYRRKYDAEQTIARFNQSLRDEVDVETLKSHLVDVVQDTMQPNQVALWIMPPKETQS
ncbi:MAG: hypothetical protein GC204_12955 [Chloroflexi bacterium]|nr:hypothetical protein [Chloroflexota bacterium]